MKTDNLNKTNSTEAVENNTEVKEITSKETQRKEQVQSHSEVQSQNSGKQENSTQSLIDKVPETVCDKLISLFTSNNQGYFIDDEDKAYVKFFNKDHLEHHNIRKKTFYNWLQKLYFEKYKKAARKEEVNNAIDNIESHIKFGDGKETKLYNRLFMKNEEIYYDLTNESWEGVKIDEEGWEIVSNPPAVFKRFTHQKSQIIPAEINPSVEYFKPLLRAIPDKDEKLLTIVWMISCFIPEFPHFLLIINGAHGSGKSVLTRWIKYITDPSKLDTMILAKDQNTVIHTLNHHWVVGFDNLSSLSVAMQDMICRAVTGASQVRRMLYTDDDDVIFNVKNCVMINGINNPATRPDLLDRSITINSRRLGDTTIIKKEKELIEEFQELMPYILGTIFEVVSRAINIKNTLEIDRLPRMADAFEWGCAITEALDIDKEIFINAYYKNYDAQTEEFLDFNLVARSITSFMTDKIEWEGTPSELLELLRKYVSEDEARQTFWPKAANILSRQLNRIKPVMEEAGYYFEITHSGARKIRIFYREPYQNTVQTDDSVQDQGKNIAYDLLDDEIVNDNDINDSANDDEANNPEAIHIDHFNQKNTDNPKVTREMQDEADKVLTQIDERSNVLSELENMDEEGGQS